MPMSLERAGPGYVGGENGFLLLRGYKSDARSTIPRKPGLWSQVVMDMT